MRILHIEDNAIKHSSIVRVIKECTQCEIDWERYLIDGKKKIAASIESGNPYDLIISDMWYPQMSGEKEVESGKFLIEYIREKQYNIPIIICSSVIYKIPGIYGTVYYSEKEDWELQLSCLIKNL